MTLAKQLAIAPGESHEFAELHDALHQQLAPEGALEMSFFDTIVHANWNLQRFRTLEAQLMTKGVDALLDEPTAKALDRLQRYSAAAQRSCYRAIHELRIVQNNRIHRRELEGHDDPLPELVSAAEVVKRIERARNEVADEIYRASAGPSLADLVLKELKKEIDMKKEAAAKAAAQRQEAA